MNKASFSLNNYYFKKVMMDLDNKASQEEIEMKFTSSGLYDESTSVFELSFSFFAFNQDDKKEFLNIDCEAQFKFSEQLNFDEIPSYFYSNSIAILFPFVRAFISTVTLQANVKALILPTMNLLELAEPLKTNSRKK